MTSVEWEALHRLVWCWLAGWSTQLNDTQQVHKAPGAESHQALPTPIRTTQSSLSRFEHSMLLIHAQEPTYTPRLLECVWWHTRSRFMAFVGV